MQDRRTGDDRRTGELSVEQPSATSSPLTIMLLTTASIVTKRLNKSVASSLLKLSLRLPSSLSSLSLPLAQKLVSIEVQDDYSELVVGKPVSRFDEFVDSAWDVFFKDMHERNKSYDGRGGGNSVDASVDDRRREASSLSDEEVEKLSEKRISILEQYLRPALQTSPDDSRDAFDEMRRQQSFVKWIRGEYLIAKFGIQASRAVKKHPELRDDTAGISTMVVSGTENAFGEEVEMPLTLPRVQVVRDAFEMRGWSNTKLPVSTWSDEDRLVDTSELPLGQIIHSKLSGQVLNSGPLNAFFEMRRREDSYELWTHEFVFGLAEYLLERIKTMDSEQPLSTTIVDVGSGDGRLCYFLQRAMAQTLQRLSASKTITLRATKRAKKRQRVQKEEPVLPTIVATDDGSWRAPLYPNPHIHVERLSSVEAISKYRPADNERLIVLCSWMPPDMDFTADWRPAAEEYILIGEYDTGSCGDNWLTWGNLDFRTESREDAPPYAQDGYQRVDLDHLSNLQFSRFDCKLSSESGTVSFRRKR